MKKMILLLIMVARCVLLYAQQDPIQAQYLLNPIVINPAYAGINNNLTATVSYRNQWTGMEGHPQTMQASGGISLVQNRVGLGMIVSHDKTGITANTEFHAAFSYKLNLGEGNVLSFGLQGGVMRFQNDYTALTPYSIDDLAFTGIENSTSLNIGAGLLYKSDRLIAGVSVPRMLPSLIKNDNQNFDLYNQHLYLFGAYTWYLDERVRLRPSVMLRAVENAPASVDVSFSFNIDSQYTAGIFTRNLTTYGLLLQALMLEKYTVGYVFELPSDKSVGTNFTTHEISLGLRLTVFQFHDKNNGGF
jgi:type IX secretion system PorP/SprF family membrane protein